MADVKIPHHFLIVAQPYHSRSGGVMVLHELCDAINKSGHKASILFMHGGSAEKQDFSYVYLKNPDLYSEKYLYHWLDGGRANEEVANILMNGTVVYPDLIVGNPLRARRVIRYVLNKNNLDFGEDYVLSYSRVYCERHDFALPKMFLDDGIHAKGGLHWRHRTLDLTYIGKGASFVECGRMEGTILVERDWPRDKEQLGLLLRQCRYFYTWDCVSATNYDAVMCGAVPVLMHDNQIPRFEVDRMEFGSFPTLPESAREGGVVVWSDNDIARIDSALKSMIDNIVFMDRSWLPRVAQFLNNYILHMEAVM